jgi:hypothetical protein
MVESKLFDRDNRTCIPNKAGSAKPLSQKNCKLLTGSSTHSRLQQEGDNRSGLVKAIFLRPVKLYSSWRGVTTETGWSA